MPSDNPSRTRLERLGTYLQADADNPVLLRDYAAEAMRAGELRACSTALERLRAAGQWSRDDAVLLARALRMQGSGDAATVLAEADQRWPGDAWVAIELAACHFAERAFEAALEALPSLPNDHPLAGAAAAMRVRLLHHSGRLDDAVREAQPFLNAESAARAPVAAAVIAVLLDLSRLDEAHALARSLVDSAPSEAQAPYEVCEPFAAAALDQDQPDQARAWVLRALDRRHDDGRIWLLKGLAELRGGVLDAATDALERAVDLMPAHPGSHLALGWGRIAAGDLEHAQSAFESAVAANPSFAESHGSLAVLAAMRGQSAEAAALIRRAQRLDRLCASALWAEQLLAGRVDPAQVSQLAREVITRARQQRRPAPATPSSHS